MRLRLGLTGRRLKGESLDQGYQETLVIIWAWSKAE